LIDLRNQMAKKVRLELVPALGINRTAVETGSAPANRDAYDAYLRTLAIPHEVKANKDAITILEKVVSQDPNYAPAWEALGRRYYFDASLLRRRRRRISALECRLPARAFAGTRTVSAAGLLGRE
jgi:cytochrome c peroxidase